MQKLKDLIQSLMEAFISFKRAFISNQAMPGDTDVIVSANPASTNPVRFVAPSDGYVYVSDRGVNNQVSSLEVNHADYGPFGTRSFGDGNSIIRLIFPVKKGRSVDINFSNTALTDIVCRFRATIGGGLNTILQSGGALCLRLTNSFKQLSSSPQRKGNLTPFIQRLQEQERENITTLFPPLMVGFTRHYKTLQTIKLKEFACIVNGAIWTSLLNCLRQLHLVKTFLVARVLYTSPYSKECSAAFGLKTDFNTTISSLQTSRLVSVFNKEVCNA